MQRRSFLGSLLSTRMLAAAPAPQSAAGPLPRARWIENGLIDAGGSHEPYTFVVRRGGYRLDARQAYEREQSEDLIRRLQSQGVEVFHTHLYKGFGMAAEAAEMADAKRTAALARRHGLKVDSYIQWNTMMYETFFAEEPRAQNWIQRDVLGRPIMLTYGYQQSYRYRPCFSNQQYLDYLKKIVRFAIEEVHTDFIHFDNFDLNPEPESCHCSVCVSRFRAFLRQKYTPAQRKERFGFEVVDYVNPPEWNVHNPPERMEIIFDPAIQEWIDFRCEIMAGALRQMAAYAKSLHPEVVIEVNPHGITGANRGWEAGLDHARILKSTEVFWTEEPNLPALLPDGRLVSKIRSYKLARRYRNILLTYISGAPLHIAECLAFNQTIGAAGHDPLTADMRRYIAFYRRYRDLFVGAEDVANIALLRSFPSITYNQRRAQLSAVLAEQALIQNRIPFDLIFDEHLEDLSKYRVLILPDSECLSDAQLRSIRDFVARGGGLVAIGQAGLYDQWRRLRVHPGLAGLVDQPPALAYQEKVEDADLQGALTRRAAGQGRAVYIPALRFDGPMPEMRPYFTIDKRFWKLPRNAAEFVEAVRWAARDEIPVQVSGPNHLIANPVTQPAHRRLMLHLVNYNPATPISNVNVSLRLPSASEARAIRLYSPDAETPSPLPFRPGLTFTIPQVSVYCFAAIEW